MKPISTYPLRDVEIWRRWQVGKRIRGEIQLKRGD
jgi:hypothetical protein